MDNLTHTLVGALVAETAARFVPVARSVLPEATRRNLYLSLMVVGSNLPDFDSLYAGITGGKIGYLVHHRGHTHTVIGALVLALLMFGASRAWLHRRRLLPSRSDQLWLAFVALLAPLLHIAMDFTNEYGVHPFWPLNNDWYYGDAIFIIEPLFWACAAPLLFLLRSRVARVLLGFVLFIGIALSFGSGLVPRPMAVGLTLLTAGLLLVGWRARPRVAAMTGLAAALAVIVLFTLTSGIANRQTTAFATAQFPDAVLLDQVLAPMPVNPVCWEVILVQLEGDDYTLRQALLSLAPGWLPADRCPGSVIDVRTTVTLTPMLATDSSAVQWLNEVTMSRTELRELIRNNCEAAAFTQFARALWFRRGENGWLVGDLRYDREPGLGFAELLVSDTIQQCPRNVPPWTPPRSDLLRPG